ncbi:MAG: hypothetical protein WBG42_04515 [Cryomorphaceae bacterium]
MRIFLLLVLSTIAISASFGQDTGDTLYLDDSKFLTRYLINDERVKTSELKSITENVPAAYEKMKEAVTFKRVSNGLKYAGAVALIAPAVGYFVLEGETLADRVGFRQIFLAAGLFIVSIPFNAAFKKSASEGAILYNQATRYQQKSSSFKMNLSPNGLSLTCVF